MKRSAKIGLGVVAAVLVLGAVGYAVIPHPVGTSTPTAQNAPLVGSSASGPPSEPGPAVDPGASPVPAPPPPAPAVVASFSSWRSGGGLDRVNALGSDFGSISAADPADAGARRAGCTSLQNDARAGKAYAPMPDVKTQARWADALGRAAQAAASCLSAGGSGDSAQQSSTAKEISAASAAFTAVTEQLSYFSSH